MSVIHAVPTDRPEKLDTHPHMMALVWGQASITNGQFWMHVHDIEEWCAENLVKGDYHKWGHGDIWAFAKAEDAFAFRMRWG